VKNVVCYLRVSSPRQVTEGGGLTTQDSICKKYAIDHNLNIVRIFTEEGESAKTADRTKLNEMMEFCNANRNEVDGILYHKIDRLSRKAEDYHFLKGYFYRLGIKIISISENIEDTPVGRFTETVLAGQAQFDNDVRTERSVNGMKTAVMEGRYCWRAPNGYKNGKINGKANLIVNEEKSKYIKRIFELVAGGFSNLEELRIIVRDEGFNVSRSELHRIVRRKLYYGFIEKLGIENTGIFEPIISRELFDKVQDVLDGRNKKSCRKYASLNEDFPLRKFVSDENGNKITGGWTRGNGGRYAYYRFIGEKAKGIKKDDLEDSFKSFLREVKLDEKYSELLEIAIRENWKARNANIGQDKGVALRKIAELENEQKEMAKKNIKGIIPDELFKSCLNDSNNLISECKAKVYDLDGVENFDDDIVKQSFKILNNLEKEWEKMEDVERKTSLQWFLFPQGVCYENKIFRTNETAFILNKKLAFAGQLSRNG
jgi:DNA invertase Pin-like site-specific DNA recombinase